MAPVEIYQQLLRRAESPQQAEAAQSMLRILQQAERGDMSEPPAVCTGFVHDRHCNEKHCQDSSQRKQKQCAVAMYAVRHWWINLSVSHFPRADDRK